MVSRGRNVSTDYTGQEIGSDYPDEEIGWVIVKMKK